MTDKIKQLVEMYKEWAGKHPTRNVFVVGFILGFIVGAILC